MEWTADVSAGDWLRERIDDPWQHTMHDVVPRGFAAYARIFHPASRDRPVGVDWPREPYTHRVWQTFHVEHADAEIVTERVSWAQAAAALGATMHAGAQWGAISGIDRYADRTGDPLDADGWRYQDPEEGGMPAELTAAIARVLAAHTTTPDEGFVALWEGSGGLLGHMGETPSRAFFQIGDPDSADLARHNEVLGRSFRDRLNTVFRKQSWQEGILSREVSEGPRFALPNRGHVLFRGGVSALARPDWVIDVPWRDRPAEDHGFAPSAQTPSLIWPADRAWVSVTEVDWDSTIVGGSADLVAALVADPRLEAFEIPAGTVLTYDSDEVNR